MDSCTADCLSDFDQDDVAYCADSCVDSDSDGYPDILLAGNDHTFDISTGYYDANKGLLYMSGEGKPLNRLLPPSESGIVLHGMVESLLYLDGDLPLIVAGINRDSVVSYSVKK